MAYLHADPVLVLLKVNRHGKVADLSGPGKPVALQKPGMGCVNDRDTAVGGANLTKK